MRVGFCSTSRSRREGRGEGGREGRTKRKKARFVVRENGGGAEGKGKGKEGGGTAGGRGRACRYSYDNIVGTVKIVSGTGINIVFDTFQELQNPFQPF